MVYVIRRSYLPISATLHHLYKAAAYKGSARQNSKSDDGQENPHLPCREPWDTSLAGPSSQKMGDSKVNTCSTLLYYCKRRYA